MSRKILLGDGISAKIFSLYNPEYLRIAPRRQSQIDVAEFQASILLSKTRWVDEFFCDMGLVDTPAELEIPIGYHFQGGYNAGNPPSGIREMIMRKKLRDMEKPESLFKAEELVAEPYLSKGNNAMVTYNIRMSELVTRIDDALLGQRDFIEEAVISITDDHVVLSSGQKMEYSHLVSTIPAYTFWKIYEGSHAEQKNFHAFPMYVAKMKQHLWDSVFPWLPKRVMCYFPEAKFTFDRVRIVPELQDDDVIIESPVPFEHAVAMPQARLIRSYDNIAPPRVMFLGRYAQWNPDVVVSNVIQRSSQKYLTEDIWSDQKAFNRLFINYAPDAAYVQQKVKDYILHLISETYSLLGCINWKIDALEPIKMERNKILEEWIDIFKFWLSIGHMFGFDVGDFERMYWDKTKRVKEKFSKKER